MKTVSGDLIALALAGRFDVIGHGCNCFCTMGAGIAKQIARHFPEALASDLETAKGDKSKLGHYSIAAIGPLTILNLYTQYDYRGSGVKVDYGAVQDCMRIVGIHFKNKRIGLPKIGCGLGGGEWEAVRLIIENYLSDCDVTIVEYDQ